MPRRIYTTWVMAPVEAVWEFHASVAALPKLTPPDRTVRIVSDELRVVNGALHELEIRMKGIRLRWNARITEVQPPRQFVDTAERSPFAAWQHRHAFHPENGGTRITDTVDYRLPFGPVGALVDYLFVRHDLDAMFAYRHQATRQALESAQAQIPAP